MKHILSIITILALAISINHRAAMAGDHTGVGNGGGDERLKFRRNIDTFFDFLALLSSSDRSQLLGDQNLIELKDTIDRSQIVGIRFDPELVKFLSQNSMSMRMFFVTHPLRKGPISMTLIQFDIDRFVKLNDIEQFSLACETTLTVASLSLVKERCQSITDMAVNLLFDSEEDFIMPSPSNISFNSLNTMSNRI